MLLKIGHMLHSILIVFPAYVLVSTKKKTTAIIEGNAATSVRFS